MKLIRSLQLQGLREKCCNGSATFMCTIVDGFIFSVCEDFDLCENCVLKKSKHDERHVFIKIKHPVDCPEISQTDRPLFTKVGYLWLLSLVGGVVTRMLFGLFYCNA